jgi:two-component system, sensor histidine kinase YesM
VSAIIKYLKIMSLRNRLIVAVIICIILPWTLTYFVSNYFTKDVLEQRAVRQSQDTLSIIELSVKQSLADFMYISNYVQFDPEFNKLLKSYQLIDPDSPNAKKEIALHNLKISNYLEGITDILSSDYITILLENGLYYTNYPIYEHNPLNFNKEPWFEDLKRLKFYETLWLGGHPTYIKSEIEDNPYLISMARTIKNSNKVQAYVIISGYESNINQIFQNFTRESNQTIFLTDKDGFILSSINNEEIGDKLPFELSNESNYQIIEYQNKKQLLVTHPVSYTKWRIVSLVPYNETIGNINMVTKTTIVIQGAFLLLFLSALIVLVRETTKPIEKLSNVTKKVEQGDLKIRTNVKGNNDIGQLAQSFDHMLDTIEEMIHQVKLQEEAKRTAELEMLQAQINPHFLFNVLNAIRLNLTMNGDQKSSKLIKSLSSLLRMTINRNNAFITLKEEIEIVQNYVDLMKFRHSNNIVLELNINLNTYTEEIPRFFLQPIIENAIIHGFINKDGKITIAADMREKVLVIKVRDDGRGINQETLAELKAKIIDMKIQNKKRNQQSFNGVGIQNVYQRLKIIYGDAFKMDMESSIGEGISFTFFIPKEKELDV